MARRLVESVRAIKQDEVAARVFLLRWRVILVVGFTATVCIVSAQFGTFVKCRVIWASALPGSRLR